MLTTSFSGVPLAHGYFSFFFFFFSPLRVSGGRTAAGRAVGVAEHTWTGRCGGPVLLWLPQIAESITAETEVSHRHLDRLDEGLQESQSQLERASQQLARALVPQSAGQGFVLTAIIFLVVYLLLRILRII